MTINIKKSNGKRWEITEVITVIRKAEVNADNHDEVHDMYKEQYHELDWWVDEEYVDDYDIEEIE